MSTRKQPSDILRRIGKWTGSTEFTKIVSDELGLSQSHAWKLIKKDQSILKEKLPSRHVLCGLREFGRLNNHDQSTQNMPNSSTQYDEYMKDIKEITRFAFYSADDGWHKLTYFIATLPLPLKVEVEAIVNPIAEDKQLNQRRALKMVIDRVSTFLWQKFKATS